MFFGWIVVACDRSVSTDFKSNCTSVAREPGAKRIACTQGAESICPVMATAAARPSLDMDSVPEASPPSSTQPMPRQRHGYPLAIFESKGDQQRFSCGCCELILREPVQAECGHRFCTVCKEEIISKGGDFFCRSCVEEGCSEVESKQDPTKMMEDRGISKDMLRVNAKCPNDMCVWAGKFREYLKHETECKHQPLTCEKCNQSVSRHKFDQHRKSECPERSITCEHCHKEMPISAKDKHMKEDCLKFPDTCLLCNSKVVREKMRRHQKQDCSQRTVDCPLEDCTNPLPLERFQQHLQKNTGKHLAWTLTQIQELHEAISALNGTERGAAAAGLSADSRRSTDAHDILKAKIDQLEEQIQNLRRSHRPAVGATGGSDEASGGGEAGATASAPVGAQGGLDRLGAMEFKVNSLEPILSVLHGEMNRCISAIEALEARMLNETRQALEFRQKIEQYEQTISTMSNTITQRDVKLRELESRLANLSQDQADGTLMWRISNFSKVRQDAISGNVSNIHSRPFYTGSIGYKMCVRLYPNGDGMGKGTHLSLFFTLMRSPHDALLPWPFKQKVYFMLIDQNFKKHIVDAFRSEPNSSSFKRPESEMNIATGCPLFMQLSKLNAPGYGYLKDDTMYIRIVVETDGLEDHGKQFDPRNVQMASGT